MGTPRSGDRGKGRGVKTVRYDVADERLWRLAELAWDAREKAFVFGPTKVGCAVLADDGRMFSGCNVEHKFRSHDVHAEVNAITSMISAGSRKLRMIVIVAEREQFTPCGACMDWILQFSEDCIVGFQATRDGPFFQVYARELMPHYPR
jgi:cytidine deaminase